MIMGIRQASPMRQSKTKSSPTASTGVTIPPTASGMVWARSVSVSAALSSICLRSRPVRLALKYPSGRSTRWATAAFRIFVATRKAARCVHMSPAKYTAALRSAAASAYQPKRASHAETPPPGVKMPLAAYQTKTNGKMPTAAETPDSPQPKTDSHLCPPAYSSSLPSTGGCFVFFCLLIFRVPFLKYIGLLEDTPLRLEMTNQQLFF